MPKDKVPGIPTGTVVAEGRWSVTGHPQNIPKGVYDYQPGTTWRTCKLGRTFATDAQARVTYQPVDPWDLTKRLERPYHVFINGTAQLSHVSLEAAGSHLVARGFNPLGEPVPLYPSETDVSATAF